MQAAKITLQAAEMTAEMNVDSEGYVNMQAAEVTS